jgi:hypothetical protein
MPMVSDGSITITTNGLADVADDTLHINADVDGMFELDIRNVTGKSIMLISGKGPAEFTFSKSAFRAGSYKISVKDLDDNIIYEQTITI